ncbi:MAG: 6-hydroxymethylpterin diphosphokinase MptE-like protein [Candidatus Bathyarchaeia archaeon]
MEISAEANRRLQAGFHLKLDEWWPWYVRIVEEFGFDTDRDRLSARILSGILSDRALSLEGLGKSLRGRNFIVFGCGPSLEGDLDGALGLGLFSRYHTVAADGATNALLERAHICPYAVVSDLDGGVRGLSEADRKGAITVIHAHGDNIDAVERLAPIFKGRVAGTTQTEPLSNVYNFGGFTDGDRAVFMLEEMGARRIVLMGMDFGPKVGRYSKPGLKKEVVADERKRRKLCFGKRLLEWLAPRASCEILNATGSGEPIKGIPRVELGNL